MKIGLIDVDGHNFPNLCLMKLSAYHKSKGDDVEWYSPETLMYDLVYMSKVFSEPSSSTRTVMRSKSPVLTNEKFSGMTS